MLKYRQRGDEPTEKIQKVTYDIDIVKMRCCSTDLLDNDVDFTGDLKRVKRDEKVIRV